MCSIVVALVIRLLYWIIYCTRLAIGKKKGDVLIVVVLCRRRIVSSIALLLLLYLFLLLDHHYHLWLIHTYYVSVYLFIDLIMARHKSSLLLLLLIFYNLTYCYYFKSTIHSDSNLSFSVVVD